MKAIHTLVIVGCGKTKLDHAAPAADLYTGGLFRAARGWAEANGTNWLIASAKCGLVSPDTQLEPYDRTLVGLSREYRRQWGAWAQRDLSRYINKHGCPDRIIVLAGKAYIEPLVAWTAIGRISRETPLDGKGIGQRLSWFKQQREECAR